MSLTIQLECPERFTCRLDDGPVPLLRSLALRNDAEDAISGVVLELTSEPGFFEPNPCVPNGDREVSLGLSDAMPQVTRSPLY